MIFSSWVLLGPGSAADMVFVRGCGRSLRLGAPVPRTWGPGIVHSAPPDHLHRTPRSRQAALRRRQSPRLCPPVRRHRPALAHRPRPHQGRRVSAQPLPRAITISSKRTPSLPTRPSAPCRCATSSCAIPAKRPGVIVLGTHYETNYPLRNIGFVGANDGAATTGLLMAIGDRLHAETAAGKKARRLLRVAGLLRRRRGHQRLVALRLDLWQPPPGRPLGPRRNPRPDQGLHARRHDRRQGPRHSARIELHRLARLAGRPGRQQVRLRSLLLPAARWPVEDDHLPFVERGVPSIDVIDLDYGPNNSYHHTAQDTMDKISAHSLTIDGDVFMETIRLIDLR